jgi:hypothetical protein
MKSIKAKAGAFIASSALVLSMAPGVFAASDIHVNVSGNGAGSTQNITLENSSEETIHQSNTTTVVSTQNAKGSTGENTISGSTGGAEQSITTGDANANNTLSVVGGGNAVFGNSCPCEPSSVVVHASGNGANSKTKVKVVKTSKKNVKQKTHANVHNKQDAKAQTGKNKIKNSTGGDNMIQTGAATTENTTVVESASNIIAPSVSVE